MICNDLINYSVIFNGQPILGLSTQSDTTMYSMRLYAVFYVLNFKNCWNWFTKIKK